MESPHSTSCVPEATGLLLSSSLKVSSPTISDSPSPAQKTFIRKHIPDMNCRDNKGNTPLHHAVLHGCSDMVSLLLNSGADPTILGDHDQQPAEVSTPAFES